MYILISLSVNICTYLFPILHFDNQYQHLRLNRYIVIDFLCILIDYTKTTFPLICLSVLRDINMFVSFVN